MLPILARSHDEAAHRIQEGWGCKAAPRTLGLYLHLPFCRVHCPYCDFATRPFRDGSNSLQYSEALIREIDLRQNHSPQNPLLVSSIFFGGGTPSLTPADELAQILDHIRRTFDVSQEAEISLEVNPENVTTKTARKWLEIGFNRLSLGIQSLHADELARLRRTHSAEEARSAFHTLRDTGWTNLNVDLIFGLEAQTVSGWMKTLEEAARWRPEHISAYNLTVETKTRFGSEAKLGLLTLPSEDEQVKMFGETDRLLGDHGFDHYEVSNYSRPGFKSRHNLNYWTGGEYLGFGLSAHTFRKENRGYVRSWNPRSMKPYLQSIHGGFPPTEGEEILSAQTHLFERIMTGLRLREGIDLNALEAEFRPVTLPEKAVATIDRLAESGLLQQDGPRIQLTRKGILLSDAIFAEISF